VVIKGLLRVRIKRKAKLNETNIECIVLL
jgi:hypothetical protein